MTQTVSAVSEARAGPADEAFLGGDPLAREGLDPARHAAQLSLLAASALTAGRPQAAYRFADRRCRLASAGAGDFLLRATASRLLNDADGAAEDLARAFEIDPTNDLVIANVLRWGAPELRRAAADSFLDGPSEDRETLWLALQALNLAHGAIVARLRVRADMREGWVAWRGREALELTIRRGGTDRVFDLEPDADDRLADAGWSAARIAIEIESPRLESVSFRLHDQRTRIAFPAASPPAAGGARPRAADPALAPDRVEVIVPVHGDYAATKACLDALAVEGSQIVKGVCVVDDCSPDPDIRALLDAGAAKGLFTLIRNDENLGFAGSVNRALEKARDCDVLLLNADTIVPRGAIDRLARAAYSQAGIGTVTPLSNNGEFTSFPKPNVGNALPADDEIGALDALASAANGQRVVDLPSGVGFCLYVTRACAEAVDGFAERYGRGYYEDVDYCLRARELGFRNVCATGVYVGHAGERSFGSEKRRLVVRNLAILNARFPDHEEECAAFLDADPLKGARARIEARLPAQDGVVLLAAPRGPGRALALERARQLQSERTPVYCEVDDEGAHVALTNLRGGAPQSLDFVLSNPGEVRRLENALAALRPCEVEVFAAHALPEALARAVFDLNAPLRAVIGDLDWLCDRGLALSRPCSDALDPGACPACGRPDEPAPVADGPERNRGLMRRLLAKADAVVPIDRMAAAFCDAHVAGLRQAPLMAEEPRVRALERGRPATPVLAVLCPEPIPEADRQIVALGRLLSAVRPDPCAIVLGRCADDLAVMSAGRVFVTGAVAEEEYERVLRGHGVTHLFSPYRTRHFGLVDRLSAAHGIPKAYFDWSFGALALAQGDLALDPRVCFEKAAREIFDWTGAAR